MAFCALSPASLYDLSKVSSTWVEVIKRSTEFLQSVACGYVIKYSLIMYQRSLTM